MSGCFDNSPEDSFHERELNEYLDEWDSENVENGWEGLDEDSESCDDKEEYEEME